MIEVRKCCTDKVLLWTMKLKANLDGNNYTNNRSYNYKLNKRLPRKVNKSKNNRSRETVPLVLKLLVAKIHTKHTDNHYRFMKGN